ncbi:hypothetical protein ACHAWU_007582 [Discostella pseudostelligera]|uniref:Uncharacterized protein n=1 Tax=Discostella pseudostelligera TaxID=259834 RepID=A0ABD3M7Y2_9STRA
MSHSSSSATQPLSDILPWGNPLTVVNTGAASSDSVPSRSSNSSSTVVVEDDRSLLVTDATSTDGRFVLHTLALQFLSSRYSFYNPRRQDDAFDTTASSVVGDGDGSVRKSNTTMEGAVLWISCAPIADRQIMMGLRKALQHNLGGSGGSDVGTSGVGKGSSSSAAHGQGGSIGNSSCGPIHIISLPLELADAALSHHDGDENPFSHEVYLKVLHRRIVHWIKYRELIHLDRQDQQQKQDEEVYATLGPRLIICDNVTTLGSLVGDRLANSFLSSVRSSIRKHSKRRSSLSNLNTTTSGATTEKEDCTAHNTTITTINLFVTHASSPDDGGLYNLDGNDSSSMGGQKLRSEYSRLLRPWLGFGSGKSNNNMDGDDRTTSISQLEEQCNYLSLPPDSVPSFLYRSGLYEVVDGIVDVSPLQSGFARDVLGRVAFVPTWSGQGWWGKARAGNASNKEDIDGAYASLCVNYRCDDSGVRIMRLRSR